LPLPGTSYRATFALSLRTTSGYFHCVPSSFFVVAGLRLTRRDPLLNAVETAVLLVRALMLTRMGFSLGNSVPTTNSPVGAGDVV
jgi:hypothetical protein